MDMETPWSNRGTGRHHNNVIETLCESSQAGDKLGLTGRDGYTII